jgi:hypothetical protein
LAFEKDMKRYIILLALFPVFISCGVSDKRIDAYENAVGDVRKASSSEALELIAYELSKELYRIDAEGVPLDTLRAKADGGDEDSKELLDAIGEARRLYEEALSDKESAFYFERLLMEKQKK